jgi:cytosine/adenosine deaminase-related metal-dependent hydrolase
MAILGPHYSALDVARHDLRLARELGLVASMHQGGGPARTPGGWAQLMDEGLVGPRLNIVHGNDLGDEELAQFVDRGVSFTVTPENEMIQGHGMPITGRLRALGTAPSLGVDLESVLSGDMLTVCRMALGLQRALDHAEHRRRADEIAATPSISVREALRWATIEGARMLGLESHIGTLTPGKKADLVVLRADLGLWPVHDPVASVVMQASAGDVEHVMIEGHFVKRDGRLAAVGLDRLRDDLAESGRRILRDHGLRAVA